MKKTTGHKTESDFQTKAIKYLESRGVKVTKVHVSAYQTQGEADIICCYKGRYIEFELKVNGNKPTKLQLFEIKKTIQAGGIARVAYSLSDIEETLNDITRIQQGNKSQQ